jgi:hypothetical protein
MMIKPNGSPNSVISESSAWRAIATSFSTAPFCSSTGVRWRRFKDFWRG